MAGTRMEIRGEGELANDKTLRTDGYPVTMAHGWRGCKVGADWILLCV